MKIGVIGAGSRIKRVLELLLKENPSIEINSVYDPSKESLERFESKFGEFKIEKDYMGVIENPEVSWVFIGSYNNSHKDQILLALKYGKNVFCEKPIAISIKELYEIRKAFIKKGRKFLISYPLRHSLHYKKIKDLIESDKIGKVVSLEFNEVLPFKHGLFITGDWRRITSLSGGHLLEKCCHDFDIVNWLIKSKAKRVSSFAKLDFFKKKNHLFFNKMTEIHGELIFSEKKLRNSFLMSKDIYDNQVVIMEYENGVRATFHTNCNSYIPERRLYICGTKGTIRSDLLKGEIEYSRFDIEEKETINFDKKMRESHGGGDSYLAREINLAMTTNYNRVNDFDDAIKSAAAAIMCDVSAKKGKTVSMDKIWKRLKF
jgi:predicted dehydrogenase